MEEKDDGLKSKLLSLKRELKGWEAMFERKHGHKPSKADIEGSADEIRETYQKYKNLKLHLSSEEKRVKRFSFEDSLSSGERRVKKVSFEDQELHQSCPTSVKKYSQQTPAEKDGVFGSSLNKKPKKANGGCVSVGKGEGEGERKNVWKLRRWSKSRGYHTVVVNGEEERDGGGTSGDNKQVPESGPAAEDEDKAKSESTEVDCDLRTELEQLSQGISFRDLTNPSMSQQGQPLTKTLCKVEEEDKLSTTPPLPVAGQCSHRLHFKMASSSRMTDTLGATVGRRGLRHCRSVSQKWLERCKPDLSKLEAAALELSGGEEESDSGGETYKIVEEGAEVMEGSWEHGGDEGEVESLDEEEEEEEEEEVWQQQEKGVELEAWQREEQEMEPQHTILNICCHDDNKDHSPPPCELLLNPLSRYEGLEVEEGSRGDNNDANSDDDSSSGDDPLINTCLGEQFEKKWEELSNSVKTLSPLKQLPTRSPHKSSFPSNIKASNKNLIFAPMRHLVSVEEICRDVSSSKIPFQESPQIEEVFTDGRTGLLHLRDSLTLLELYGSKDRSTTVQANTQSLVSRLLNSSELSNGCPTKRQSRDNRTNKWKLLPSARAKNFANMVTSSSVLMQTSNGSSQNPPSVLDLPQLSRPVLSPSQQLINSTQPVKEDHFQPTDSKTSAALTSPSASANSPTSLDSSVRVSVGEGDKSGRPAKAVDLDIESDLCFLSRDSCVARGTESSVATSGRRNLRRGRGQVHSTAAVISEVELKDGEKTREMDTHGEPVGGSVNHSGRSFESDCQAVQNKERMTTDMESRTSSIKASSEHRQEKTALLSRTPGDSGLVSGRGKGSAVSDNFVRLNMKVKRFSRGRGRSLSGSAYKRHMWKKRQAHEVGGAMGGAKKSVTRRNVCFKCGKPGHWAKNCTDNGGSKNLGKFAGEAVSFNDNLLLGREDDLDPAMLEELAKNSPFPTVHEAAMMARGVKFDASKVTTARQSNRETDGGDDQESAATESFVPPPPYHTHSTPPPPSVDPLYPPTEEGIIASTPQCVFDTLKKFGYQSFRPGQEEAIMNILSGVSTLLIHSTGSGKSLCYQLPAYLYSQFQNPCTTLVISPLVSLMEDQIRHFPPGLKGACLHTNQTRPQQEKVLCDVVEGRINVLLLSPEALVGGAFWRGRGSPYSLSRLPPVAFACIDEAHCVSEWSHNFRPSYLRIHKVLKDRLGVHCILALTATATHTTGLSVASHLGIDQANIIRGNVLPDNLHISVSCDRDRDQALVELLQSSKFRDCESIIIYCTRQQQTERVAQLLRTCLQSIPETGMGMEEGDPPNMETSTDHSKGKSRKRKTNGSSSSRAKRRKMEWSADSYHAGMSAAQRKRVQTDFMSGKLRIVVATVAFGMGLNKSDVRAIIHYNMPKSFESFVQEIGRAGRDGLPAYCHVFIDTEGSDICELRRHAYSNAVDPYTVKQLVGKAFPVCHCREQKQLSTSSSQSPLFHPSHHSTCCHHDSTHPHSDHTLPDPDSTPSPPSISSPRWCAGHEVAIPIEETVQQLDIKEECVSTLLCYLELRDWVEVVNVVNDSCSVKCYGGARQLRALAQKVPAVAAAAARLRERGTDLDKSGEMTFSVIEVANSMGWESHIVRSELSGLQYNDRGTGDTCAVGSIPSRATSTVLTEFSGLAFHLRSPGDFTPEERDHICGFLSKKVKGQEEREVEKLHLLHVVLRSIAQRSHFDCGRDSTNSSDAVVGGATSDTEQSTLRKMICRYFSNEGLNRTYLAKLDIPVLPVLQEITLEQEQQVRSDVQSLCAIHCDLWFTGRTVARIFHGIASPLFPAEVWGRQPRFWRRHLDVDFNLLCQIATTKLLELR